MLAPRTYPPAHAHTTPTTHPPGHANVSVHHPHPPPTPRQVSFGAGETMSLKQLSGGQKTLVALALIFAIQVRFEAGACEGRGSVELPPSFSCSVAGVRESVEEGGAHPWSASTWCQPRKPACLLCTLWREAHPGCTRAQLAHAMPSVCTRAADFPAWPTLCSAATRRPSTSSTRLMQPWTPSTGSVD